MRRDLLDPAGLDRVAVQPTEQPEPPLARPVADLHGEPPPDDGPYLPSLALASLNGTAGGMAADAPSIARWMHLLYGGHVLSSSLIEQMTSGDNEDDWYGLGTLRGMIDGQFVVGHGGDVPGYTSLASVFTRDAVTVAVLVPQSRQASVIPDVSIDELFGRLHDIGVGGVQEVGTTTTS